MIVSGVNKPDDQENYSADLSLPDHMSLVEPSTMDTLSSPQTMIKIILRDDLYR